MMKGRIKANEDRGRTQLLVILPYVTAPPVLPPSRTPNLLKKDQHLFRSCPNNPPLHPLRASHELGS